MRKYILMSFCFFTILFNFSDNKVIKTKYPQIERSFNTEDTIKPIQDSLIYTKKGGLHSATWYNPHGARTASGLRFHRDSLTCAYNFSKMHSVLRVTNTYNNESVIVKVTDRMGNKSKNHIDLSKAAFDSIGNPKSGRIKVVVEEISILK